MATGAVVGAVVVDRTAKGTVTCSFEEVAAPGALAAGMVSVTPAFVGICGSDLEQLHGRMPETFRIGFPHILGHEWSGTVAGVGEGVTGFTEGDRVIGHGDLGDNRWFGVTQDGAMAEEFHVPAAMCFVLPESISMASAAVIEPFACVLNALRKVRHISAADRVNVFGLGAIGLSAVIHASLAGADVTAIDLSALRRDRAVLLGADRAVMPGSDAIALADLVIEASGAPAAQAAAVHSAAAGATVLFMGVSRPRDVPVQLGLIQERELTLLSSTGAPPSIWPAAVRLVERAGVDLGQMVTSVYPFTECAAAIERAQLPEDEIKVLLAPTV